MEEHIKYFSFFGGLNLPLDLDQPLNTLITKLFENHYDALSELIFEQTQYQQEYHRLLSAIAQGDRRLHSAFKRARMSETKGGIAINALQDLNILRMEYSRETPPCKAYPKQKLKKEIRDHRISHKLQFRVPFLRFWFYFVAPFESAIAQGDYTALLQKLDEHHNSFSAYTFEKLSNLFLETQLTKDPIIESGSYWDRQVEIDLYAQRSSGAIIVGECKWRNHKMNKKELHKLRDKCEKINLEPQYIALFSKRGFSNELEQTKDTALLRYSAEDFKTLLR